MKKATLPSWTDLGLHGLLGSIFLISGLVKAIHPQLLASHFTYRLLWFPDFLALPATYLLASIELLVGAALTTRFQAHRARPAAAILLGVFVIYLLASMVLGVRTPCQCYGQLIQLPPILSLGLDILFLGGLALLERRGTSTNRFMPFALLAGLVLIIIGVGRFSPTFDILLVQTRPGFILPTLPSLHPEALNRDFDRLVLMVKHNPSEETLSKLRSRFPNHQLVLLTDSSEEVPATPNAICIEFKPDLEAVFVKTWPTCFTISSQKIEAVWYGRFPRP